MNWIKIWTFFFFLSLTIFAFLSVVVTIGGFFDIKSLFKDLLAARQNTDSSSTESDD